MNEELKIIISAETAKLQKACQDATREIEGMSKKGSSLGSNLEKAFKQAGKAVGAATKTIAKGIGLASAAMVGLTAKAVSAAGELEQNIGGSEQVFGEFSKNIQGYAKDAYAALGLSTSEYLATANKMGALLQGSGFTIEESMNLSTQCMQRAADVASIMGIDTTAAMEAIAGAAKGNFTMMDNLGVAMNATTIEAYALSQGITKTYNEMSNQEKEAIALQMFLEKTSYAAGNYAKENATLAGSLNTAKAAFTNFLDGSGSVDAFVEAATNAGQVILENIISTAPNIVQGVVDILNGIMPLIPQFIEQLLPVVLDGAITLINGLVESIPELINILIEALPLLIEGLVTIIGSILEQIQIIIPIIIQAIVEVIPQLCQALIELLPQLIETGISVISALLDGIIQVLPEIIKAVVDLIPEVVDALIENIPVLLEAAFEFFSAIVDAIPEIIPELIEQLPIIFDKVMGMVQENMPVFLDAGVELFLQLVDAIPEIIPALVEALPQIINTLVNTLIDSIPVILAAAVKLFMGLVDAIPEIIPALINGLADIVSTVTTNLINKLLEIMGFDWKLPKLKLPHVNIEGEFSLVPPEIPKFSISWYAKGGVFDNTHLFNFGNGSLGGLGEDGAEAVVPLEKNTEWLDKIAARLQGNAQPVILMVDGKVFGEVAVNSINGITAQRGSIPLTIM